MNKNLNGSIVMLSDAPVTTKTEMDTALARGYVRWCAEGLLAQHNWDHMNDCNYLYSDLECAAMHYSYIETIFRKDRVAHYYYRFFKARRFLNSHRHRLANTGYPLRAGILEEMLNEALANLRYNYDTGETGYWQFGFDFNEVIETLKSHESYFTEQLKAARYLEREDPVDANIVAQEIGEAEMARIRRVCYSITPEEMTVAEKCRKEFEKSRIVNHMVLDSEEEFESYEWPEYCPDEEDDEFDCLMWHPFPSHLEVEAYIRECHTARKAETK